MNSTAARVLINYLASSYYPEDYTKSQKRRLREKAKVFTLEDRTLYHIGHNGKRQKVVIGEEEKMTLMQSLHSHLIGGCHFGQNATIKKLSDRFWWKTMTADIKTFCQQCQRCQRSNASNKPQVATLHPVPVKGLFHRWGIDLVGPLKETSDGKRYVIVATEYLTRWVEVGALENKSAESIHAFLLSLVYRYGSTEVLLHDQGREFCNKLVRELCDIMDMDQTMTSAYHPQTNGLTERFNQTMVTQLMKLVNDECNDWDQYIHAIAFAYRTNKQSSTKYLPFELLYGQKPRLPVDLEYQVDDATCDVDMDDVGTRMKQLADLTKHRDTAQDNISDAQKKQKKRYDIKHRGSIFEIGDHVAIVNRRRDTRKGDKLAPRFKGPYTVTQTLGKGLYVLKKGDAVLKTKYNAVNLKRWNKPESATKSVRTEELPQRSSKWVPKFKLNESDRCDILNGAWLSDRVIDACHMLITESTGIQNQSTLLKQTAFKPMDTTVQILHDHDHWVTVSGSKDGIQFADSIPSHPITDNIKRQMKEIFKNRLNTDGSLTVTVLDVQPQPNGNDCGVFAIANAFQLAQDMSPSVKYNIANMRNHILKCIEDRKMRAFDYMSLRKKSMDKIVCI